MDIAEIRKKAKTKPDPSTGGAAKLGGSAGLPPELADAGPGSLPEPVGDIGRPLPAGGFVPASSSPGLDRLFSSGEGMQFATEEAYQTALASQEVQEDAGSFQLLAFQLGPEEYALDIARISEIIKPRDYTDIPRVPEFILGLISLRGVVVPVFDLRRRFKLGETQIGAASRVIVCREGDVTAGLLVDSINQVIKLSADRIEPPPAVLTGLDRNLVEGVGRFQGRMIILLNLASVLDVELT